MEQQVFSPVNNTLVTRTGLAGNEKQVLPLVVQPAKPGLKLNDWLQSNKNEFEADLVKHGGILLRGFGIDTPAAFQEFMKCFNTDPLPYMFRSSPRKELDNAIKNIYQSTTYPKNRSINMHNESSYSRIWGRKIIFCCLQPAEQGGETPIADSRRVLQDIDPALVQKFRARGVRYRRNLLPDLGMPWQEVFQTNDLATAEQTCKKYNISYSLQAGEKFVIEWVKPAVYRHPVSDEETWFNHVLFFNKFSRYQELGIGPGDSLPEEYLTSDTFFGDGGEISYAEYTEIQEAYDRNKVVFPYQQGDILFLDNMLAAHGRNPYKGERTIATAIIEASYDPGMQP
jgi:alpha-ketoglutarate-dependent taurine dioxygenase